MIKGHRQTHSCWLIEVLGAVHDIDTEALGKTINGHLQLAATTTGVEQIGLGNIITAHQIICDKTN